MVNICGWTLTPRVTSVMSVKQSARYVSFCFTIVFNGCVDVIFFLIGRHWSLELSDRYRQFFQFQLIQYRPIPDMCIFRSQLYTSINFQTKMHLCIVGRQKDLRRSTYMSVHNLDTRQLPMGAGYCQWGGLTD